MSGAQPSVEAFAEAVRPSDESSDGTAGAESFPTKRPNPRSEYQQVHDQLDQLGKDLQPRGGGGTPAPPLSPEDPPPSESLAAGPPETVSDTESSPYLEERLAVASGSLSSLGKEVQEMGERWTHLQGTVADLRRELGNAAREVDFIRSAGAGTPAPGPVSRLSSAPAGSGAVISPSTAPFDGGTTSPPYLEFTSTRYNATIDGLKGRRLRLAIWTLVLAALISAALVALALWAREPVPSMWLAVLPAVWMVPVPFFLLSFWGTQRVLRRNHLNVAGDS
jgi:hypothetical protein